MNLKKLSILLCVILLVAIIIPACSTSTPTPTSPAAVPTVVPSTPALTQPSAQTSTSAAATGPKRGGILTVIAPLSPSAIGHYPGVPLTMGAVQESCATIFETLLILDSKGDPAPNLATAWQIGADGKSITLTLRQGVKFHDGTDFNADAVKYNIDSRIAAKDMSLASISSVDALDNYTVRLNLAHWDIGIYNWLDVSSFMISPTGLKNHDKQWAMDNPVGTGPFKFVSFQPDVSLKLTRFDGYWQPGKPYLDGLEFKFVADPFTAVAAFKSGQGQILMDPNPKDASSLQTAGYVLTKCPAYATSLAGDSKNPDSPFANIKVRQAVSYAINRDALVKGLGYGILQPILQPADSANYWYSPDIKGYPYDPAKAKALLTEANYPSGFNTTLIVPTSKSGDFFVQVQQDLQQVGIKAELQTMDDAAFNKLCMTGWKNSLIFLNAFFLSIGADEGQFINTFFSGNGPLNVSVDYNAEYMQQLALINSELDLNKRKAEVQQLMKIVTDQYCMATVITENYAIAVKTKQVHDEYLYTTWAGQWTPVNAWLGD